jgi:hypothetical protein
MPSSKEQNGWKWFAVRIASTGNLFTNTFLTWSAKFSAVLTNTDILPMQMISVPTEKGKTMFCEDFDKCSEVYVMRGGSRGNGAICFLYSRNAKLRAQLDVANAKIEEMKKENIRLQISAARLNGKKPYVVYVEEPAVPGPEIADPNIMELCFHNGERHMKEKVISILDAFDKDYPYIDYDALKKAMEGL